MDRKRNMPLFTLGLVFCAGATVARAQTNVLTNVPAKLVFSVDMVVRPPVIAAPVEKPRVATNSPAAPSRELQAFRNREQEQIQRIADSMWKPGDLRRTSLIGALLNPTPGNLYGLVDLSARLPEQGPGSSRSVWSWDAPGGQWPPATPLSSDPSKNMPAGLSLGP